MSDAAKTTWIDPTREEMLQLMETADHVTIGNLASGVRVIDIGKQADKPGRYGELVRTFVFHARAADVPELADRAESLGRCEFAAELRSALDSLVNSGSAFHG